MDKVFRENKLNVKMIEDSPPKVKEVIKSSTNFLDISERCLSECTGPSCNFRPIKNINEYGYHYILRVTPND